MAKVLAISSHVVRGHVGLDATVPALQWLGHEVWALPTVLLASRPGPRPHGAPRSAGARACRHARRAGGRRLLAVARRGVHRLFPIARRRRGGGARRSRASRPPTRAFWCWSIRSSATPAASTCRRRPPRPSATSCCRSPTVATPNLFELHWLTGTAASGTDASGAGGRAARARRPWSSPRPPRRDATVTTLLVTVTAAASSAQTPRRAGIPNGAGDLFAGLLLGHLLNGRADEAALDASLADLDRVLAASAGRDVLQLSALNSELGHDAASRHARQAQGRAGLLPSRGGRRAGAGRGGAPPR